MTWDANTGTFTPGGSGQVSLPGQSGSSGSKNVTVQDLINLGLIDPGVASGGHTLFSPATTRFTNAVASALQDSAASIELNSATLFKKMNGLAGVVIGSGGIAGYDSAGTATFTIDPATGDVTISGTITATAGAIGGWTIGATALTAGSGATTVGIDSAGTNPAFYAGSATPGSAPFRVTQAGAVTATSGAIGGFDIGSDYIRDTANTFGLASTTTAGADVRLWCGDTYANRNTAPVRLYDNNSLFLYSLTVGAGNIGGNLVGTVDGAVGSNTPSTIVATSFKPDTNGTRDIGDATHYIGVTYTVYVQCGGTIFVDGTNNQTFTNAGMISQHATHNLAAGTYKLGAVPTTGTAPYLYFNVGGKVCLFVDATGAAIAA